MITDALERHGQGGSGEPHDDEPYFSSFLIADARGGWIVETSSRTWAARPVGDGASISNRISARAPTGRVASPDVATGADFDAWRSPSVPTSIADHRLAATRAVRRPRSRRAVADVVATLRDHGHGPWGAPSDADAHPAPADGADDGRDVTVCMHLRELPGRRPRR